MKKLTLISLPIAALFLVASVHAESLNDQDVKNLYVEEAASIHDTALIEKIMRQRLDDAYTLKLNESSLLGSGLPQISTKIFNKAQSIENAIKGQSIMSIDNYQYEVSSVKYSEDKKFAYTTYSTLASGKIHINKDGQDVSLNYETGSGCIDMLDLIDNKVRILKTECNSQVTFTK